MRVIALLGLLTLSACSNSNRCTVEGSFSDAQRQQLYRAAEQWNAITTADAQIELTTDDETDCRVALRDQIHIANDNGRTVGRTTFGAHRLVTLARELGEGDTFYAVALHEFGHIVGLGHLPPGQYGVMQPIAVWATAISPADLSECQRVRACP